MESIRIDEVKSAVQLDWAEPRIGDPIYDITMDSKGPWDFAIRSYVKAVGKAVKSGYSPIFYVVGTDQKDYIIFAAHGPACKEEWQQRLRYPMSLNNRHGFWMNEL